MRNSWILYSIAMPEALAPYIPTDAVKILLVLGLSILLGLERETRKVKAAHYYFGGVATFPLLGLLGFGAAALSSESLIPLGVGFAVIGGFLLISYRHKLDTSELSGFVTELTGLVAYLQGSLVFSEHYWLATTLVVLTLIILELKKRLEVFTHKMPSEEIFVLGRFLFLTAVILPIVPNKEFTAWHLNPFKIWMVVVVVSALSYFSYLLQRLFKEKGILLSALIGGTYSSTAVTVTLSKRSRELARPHLCSGAILLSCGLMFLRALVLLALFNFPLAREVYLPLLVLSAITTTGAYLWSRIPDTNKGKSDLGDTLKNPLEILTAFLFALIFTVVLIATHFVLKFYGDRGIYYLAASVGAVDVDPFLLSLTQNAGGPVSYSVAAAAVLLALSANNLIKGIYALIFGERKTSVPTAIGLGVLTLLGLAAIWLL